VEHRRPYFVYNLFGPNYNNKRSKNTHNYQKDLNYLYLRIPPISAHLTSCFKGLFVGELLQDWNQNSSPQDFINITNHFILCLLQCQQYPTRNDSDIQPKLQYNLESTGDIAETNKHDHGLNKSP
jgi:hypothetical protein